MSDRIRILLLEDSRADAKLIERELRTNGFCFELIRARAEPELFQAMAAAPPDLVLSNHCLWEMDGFRALSIVHRTHPDLPFIFVSGSNDQQLICNMFEEGATDYVFKRDLRDLPAAVGKALGVEPKPNAPPENVRSAELLPKLFLPGGGFVTLCPNCHQARDEAGELVALEDYCYHRLESLVILKVCKACSQIELQAALSVDVESASSSPARIA